MKKEDIIGYDVSTEDKLLRNLNLRIERKPASHFEWDNPEEADGVPILARNKVSASDPNVKIAYDNFSTIANTKSSYLASNIQRNYSDDIPQTVQDKYEEFDRLNNFQPNLTKMMASCATSGVTYSLCYIDAQNKVRFKRIQGWKAKVIYDELSGEPILGYIYYKDGAKDVIKEYDYTNVRTYISKENADNYSLYEEVPHGFTELPLIEWSNNEQKQGNAQKATSLIDGYDRLMSDNVTEWATFRNAYLLLKKAGVIDDKAKKDMQKTGIFTLDDDGAEAKFLTKDVNPEFTKFITQETWSGIWIVACSVDPKAVSTLSNATAFQIAQMYKLMEEDCKKTETEWQVSLEYLDRVLKSFWTGLDTRPVEDYSTYDINYIFNRNIPNDIIANLEAIKRAGGNLPQVEIFKRALGINQEEAQELVDIAGNEVVDTLPDFQ